MLCHNRLWVASALVRSFSSSGVSRGSHYDVLGLTPKATQSDIKSAYYKLSMLHHPDKSDDVTSARKFRSINEAYEVLGNVKLKKLYDKGLLMGEAVRGPSYQPEQEPTDPELKFYKSRVKRQATPTMDGRTPIYDFDAWTRNHYGEVFRKTQRDKEFVRNVKKKQNALVTESHQQFIVYTLFTMVGLLLFCVANGTEDFDVIDLELNKRSNTNKAQETSP